MKVDSIMSSQANVVLANGETTPVNKTFAPKGALRSPTGKDVAEWREQSAVNAEGFFSLTEQHTDPNGNRIEKFRYVIEIPTLETVGTNDAGITPAPSVAYVTTGVVEVWMSTRASQAELKDIVAFVKNFTATTYFSDAIKNREHAW
jgi:hypothetical protein